MPSCPLCPIRRAVAPVLFLLLAAAASAPPATAQVYPPPPGLESPLRPVNAVHTLTLDSPDVDALLARDVAAGRFGVPLRFATPVELEVDPASAGTWERLDEVWVWRLRIRSDGATSLGVSFEHFRLPHGALLHVYATDGSFLVRPFNADDNKEHGRFAVPHVPGGDLVIELVVPDGMERTDVELDLESVAVGYRDIWGGGGLEKSGSCNVDVVCPEGDGWRDEIRGVARIIIANFTLCSAFLLETVPGDDRPVLATAEHCGVTTTAAETLQVFWNYENSTCRTPGSTESGGTGDGTLDQFQVGSTLLFSDGVSDFTLVELTDPPAEFGVHLLGWNAQDLVPTSAVAIHHPQGDEKRISFENDPLSITSFGLDSSPGDETHLRVADWDVGTTEPGSSGSPLLDDQGRVVGELHGGLAACGNDDPDWYGRLRTAYLNGASAILDPESTGTLVVDGRDFGDVPIFTDGFESGDVSAWTSSVP